MKSSENAKNSTLRENSGTHLIFEKLAKERYIHIIWRKFLYFMSFIIMTIALVILSLIIIVLVGMQGKGAGLSIIQGTSDFGKFERRGPEKVLHNATIVLIALFVALTIISYMVS